MSVVELVCVLKKDIPVSMEHLSSVLSVSDRTIRSLIKQINTLKESQGFEVVTIRTKGYQLRVLDEQRFQSYITNTSSTVELSNRQQRISFLLFYLLQQDQFSSLQSISDIIGVSRNTLISDLEELDVVVKQIDLILVRRSHYGIRLTGSEKAMRKAFSKFVVHSNNYISMTKDYFDFIEKVDLSELKMVLKKTLESNHLTITQVLFDSLMDHLRVLLYRVSIKNYVSTQSTPQPLNVEYVQMASTLVQWIRQRFQLVIPMEEVDYLASQIAGKTSVQWIDECEKEELLQLIDELLLLIDEEFVTKFSLDDQLKEALLMHMYPLISRMTHHMLLNNPLVDEVSSRYANVFLIALRFYELWQKQYDKPFDLSRDEIGYLALHFAGNIERAKQQALHRIKRVLIISDIGRGNLLLLKEKIQDLLPRSIVDFDSMTGIDEINQQDPHLILSTITFDDSLIHAPVIYIKEILDEQDLHQIKDLIILKTYINRNIIKQRVIADLFDSRFFRISDQGGYLELIDSMARRMMDASVASEDFAQLVMERELKFSTIYQHGIAGPHGMILNGLEDKIGVIIPRHSVVYDGKPVSIIFLINICKGNLFLYREISKFLLALMDRPKVLKDLIHSESFEHFAQVAMRVDS